MRQLTPEAHQTLTVLLRGPVSNAELHLRYFKRYREAIRTRRLDYILFRARHKGLVDALAMPNDEKAKLYALTNKGRRLLRLSRRLESLRKVAQEIHEMLSTPAAKG